MLHTTDLAAELDELAEREEPLEDDECERFDALHRLEDEIGSSEFRDGIELIDDDEFEDHARDMAVDTGMIPNDTSWPCNCIDWERAANDLRGDYSLVTFDGTDYYYRA